MPIRSIYVFAQDTHQVLERSGAAAARFRCATAPLLVEEGNLPSPRRPIVTASEYEALLAASEATHSLFSLALIVVHQTGHRIGAVRLLRWTDIDLEQQLVRWRAENDKIGYEHETWLTTTAVELSKPRADHSR